MPTVLREADAIFLEELHKAGWYDIAPVSRLPYSYL
jgi:GMP synthase PP-ATPase subunit